MPFDVARLYGSAEDFFALDGDAVMKLTAAAAEQVCLLAAEAGFAVLCVEGGVRNGATFAAKLDCIWDGAPAADVQDLQQNNKAAAEFVRRRAAAINAFIITLDDRAVGERRRDHPRS